MIATAELADRIVGAIASATSKQPANAADVLALVGGEESAYWAALESLIAARRVCSAHIHRPAVDPAPWLAIYPAAGAPRRDSLHAINARGGFRLAPPASAVPRFPRRPDPTRDPRPDLRTATTTPTDSATKETPPVTTEASCPARSTTTTADQRRSAIAKMVAGLPLDRGLPLKIIAQRIGLSVAGVEYLLRTLIADQTCAKGKAGGKGLFVVYDPKAEAASASAVSDDGAIDEGDQHAIVGIDFEPEPESQAPDVSSPAAPEIRFGLWDDGSLTIIDGDDVIQLETRAVRRLALLLGVSGEAREEVRA